MAKIKYPVQLSAESASFFYDLIEKWIFFRKQKYKNNPRGNFLIYRSAGSVLIVSLCFIIIWFVISCLIISADKLSIENPCQGMTFIFTPTFIGKALLYYLGAGIFLKRVGHYCNTMKLFHCGVS